MRQIKKALSSAWIVPLVLLAVCLASYALVISKLGIYMDDWSLLWTIHFWGPASFKEVFAVDRPLLGWFYVLTSSLFKESPLAWQIFGIFTRWLSCLACWWALRGLWPRRTSEVTGVALLFAVYPGFISQFIPITYAHHIAILALTLFSLGAMNWALRRPRQFWLLYLAALVSSGLGMFTMEYYFGLELLRPVLLWLILAETTPAWKGRLRRLGMYWGPYVLLMAAFLSWRIATPTPRGAIVVFERLRQAPLASLFRLGSMAVQDLFESTVLAWKQVFTFSWSLPVTSQVFPRYILVVLGVGLLASVYLVFLDRDNRIRLEVNRDRPEFSTGRRWGIQAIWLGIYALLLGGLPVWMTNLHLELAFPWDRFTMAMMLGASLLLSGLIALLVRPRLASSLLLGIAVGLAAGMHFQVGLSYRLDWLMQQDFFWQLAWRAPAIQPGSLVLTSELPFAYDSDNSLTAPLNWIYAPQNASWQLAYLMYDAAERGLPEEGSQNIEIDGTIRMFEFHGSTSQAIAVLYSPQTCLKLVDPLRDERLPDKPPYFHELLVYSRPELVSPSAVSASRIATQLFGSEPEHGWCYYFQKAEMALQMGDWEQVASLADKALEGKPEIERRSATEALPFIEGYARSGRWDQAQELTRRVYRAWQNARLALCDTWRLVHQETENEAGGEAAYEQMHAELGCKAP
jgi:hypothetical protein